jgi:hypothetical protein
MVLIVTCTGPRLAEGIQIAEPGFPRKMSPLARRSDDDDVQLQSEGPPTGWTTNCPESVDGVRPLNPTGRYSVAGCPLEAEMRHLLPRPGERGGQECGDTTPPEGRGAGWRSAENRSTSLPRDGAIDSWRRAASISGIATPKDASEVPLLVLKRGLWRPTRRDFTLRGPSPWRRRLGKK